MLTQMQKPTPCYQPGDLKVPATVSYDKNGIPIKEDVCLLELDSRSWRIALLSILQYKVPLSMEGQPDLAIPDPKAWVPPAANEEKPEPKASKKKSKKDS